MKHYLFGVFRKDAFPAKAIEQWKDLCRDVMMWEELSPTDLALFAIVEFLPTRRTVNHIGNFRAAVLGYAALIEASRHGADDISAKRYRAAGRLLVDMEVLLFICFRLGGEILFH